MEYANRIILLFMCLSISYISCQQTENSTEENQRTNLNLILEKIIDHNKTSVEAEKNQSSLFSKVLKNETTESDTVLKEKLDLNLTDISAEKNQSFLSTKEFLNETENMVSLINSLMTNSSIRPSNELLKSSSLTKSDVNYTMETSPSKSVEFREASEMMKREKLAASSKLMQGIQHLKNNHNLSTSANNLFKLVVPYVHPGNPSLIGIWKVPHEVLMTNKKGKDIIKPASIIESRSFITNPEISSVRLNLAFPATLKKSMIESRSPIGFRDSPDYDSGEPYSSSESGESSESGVHTDDGRFLEDDYRKEIEKEAEAFIKKQKAENATNNGKQSSAEVEKPGSMENNYHKSIETGDVQQHTGFNSQEGYFSSQGEKRPTEINSQHGYYTSQGGKRPIETNSQHGYYTSQGGKRPIETNSQQGYFTKESGDFTSQGGKRPIETNSQQGYFSNHNGNKVFFYKGNDNFFNIDDVFPLLKFDQMYNQPLIDDYPEGFYTPHDHINSFSQVGHSENPPEFLHTIDSHIKDKDNFHYEAPDIHSNYQSSMEESPCSLEQNDIEEAPESDPGIIDHDYHNSEPNYDTNHQDSTEFEGESTPSDYHGNEKYKQTFEPHPLGDPPEYNSRPENDSRENYKAHVQEKKYPDEQYFRHNPKTAQGEFEYERKKSQVHQYQMHQKYQAAHHEEKSTLRRNLPKTPYHFHSESNIKSKPEAQTKSIENYSDAPHNQKESISSLNTQTQIPNHNFVPSHNPNFIIHNQNKNSHAHQHHNHQHIELPSHGQNTVPENRNNNFQLPLKSNQQYIGHSHQNFIPSPIQNPNFIPSPNQNPNFIPSPIQNPNIHRPPSENQHFIPSQVQKPDIQSKGNFHSAPTLPNIKPDCQGTESYGSQNDHTNPPSFHEQRNLESPHSVAIAIARSTNLALRNGVKNYNARYPISTLMALASSERNIEKTRPKKKSKRSKQNSHVKRSKARKRNGRNHSRKPSKKKRKTRRSTRDNMKAEAATYHWGLENHKDKDGFFMYANNPSKDDYEYGYRVGGPQQTLERHHKTEGDSSTIKLNWEDQNGDSGDQYWEFNHGSSEEEKATKHLPTAKKHN